MKVNNQRIHQNIRNHSGVFLTDLDAHNIYKNKEKATRHEESRRHKRIISLARKRRGVDIY